MKYKYSICIAVSILFLCITSICFFYKGKPINSMEDAISVSQKYVNKKYDDDFSDYEIHADLDEGIWTVTYSKNNKSSGTITLSGGGPKVLIKQSSGRIIYCKLQK